MSELLTINAVSYLILIRNRNILGHTRAQPSEVW